VNHRLAAALVLVLAGGTLALATPAHAQPFLQPERPSPGHLSRMDRVEWWLSAVERHIPGIADEPAIEVRSWPRGFLQQLGADVSMVATLIHDPSYSVLWRRDRRGRPRRTPYTTGDADRLRAFAAQVSKRGGENPILKFGAMLHTDAGRLATTNVDPSGTPADRRSSQVTVYFTDGRQLRLQDAAGHFELAQRLLDNVAPDPAMDETVRLWYLATAAYLQSREQFEVPHLERGLELFPDDPELLFLAGCLHETLASPRLQGFVRSVDLPDGVSFNIGSERSELRAAEELFRRALDVDQGLVEARIRLGRLLGLLDRHDEAADELGRAAAATSDPLLLYYATLFLGGEADATGDEALARASYERAASLYANAQSPHLALSQLAARHGDRVSALEAIRRVLDLPADIAQRSDPWWTYRVEQSRDTIARFNRLYVALAAEDQRWQR
jgi:tetratricopeptide (TPR) repeat protein